MMKKKVGISTKPLLDSVVISPSVEKDIAVTGDMYDYLVSRLNIPLLEQTKQQLVNKATSLEELTNYIRVINIGGESLVTQVLGGAYDADN